MSQSHEKQRGRHRARNILFGFIGSLLGLYAVGVVVFLGRFPFRTYLDGRSLFLYSVDEVAMDAIYRTNQIALTCYRNDGTYVSIAFSDLGVYRDSDFKALAFDVNPFTWPLSLFSRTDYVSGNHLAYDKTRVKNALVKLDWVAGADVTRPKDAYVGKTEDGFVVVPEVYGNQIDVDKLCEVIYQCLDTYQLSMDLEEEGCYVKPKVLSDDEGLAELCKKGNSLVRDHVLVLDGSMKVELDAERVLSFLYRKGQDIVADTDAIRLYVQELKSTYDTVGIVRKFQSTLDGELLLEPSGHDNFYGYDLNERKTVNAIAETLLDGGSTEARAVWDSKGFGWDANTDIGDTYLEVSLKHQKLWYYLDGKLILETDVTTGKDIPEQATPKGMFHVMELRMNHMMYGDYGSAYVAYFVRATSNGVAIHDASWRSEYGSDEYVENGSHGCINVPYDEMAVLYEDLASLEDFHIPIIIY